MEETTPFQQFVDYLESYMDSIEQKLMASVPTGNELIVLRAQYGYAMEVMDRATTETGLNFEFRIPQHPLERFHNNDLTSIVSDDYVNIGEFRAYHNIFNKLAKILRRSEK